MAISMSLGARYVTQSGIYDNPTLGPLTDRKIAKYQKEGKLTSPGFIGQCQKAKKKKRTTMKKTIKEIEHLFGNL